MTDWTPNLDRLFRGQHQVLIRRFWREVREERLRRYGRCANCPQPEDACIDVMLVTHRGMTDCPQDRDLNRDEWAGVRGNG